jgi:hypothetical protein
MKMHSVSALASLSILASIAGCSQNERSSGAACRDPREDGHSNSATLVFHDGDSLTSRVEQTTREDGSMILRGDTHLPRQKMSGATRVLEHVEIDAKGRLVYADVSAMDENGTTTRRMLLDAAHGAVFVQDNRGAAWTKVETDEPWLYGGLSENDAAFALPTTAVAAWAALSAARTSSKARIFDGSTRHAASTTIDQIVVEKTGSERFVVLGDGFATGDGKNLTSLERSEETHAVACNPS